MKIGELRPLTNDLDAGLVGRIQTLQYDLAVQLEPTGAEIGGQKPTHTIAARNAAGRLVHIGAGWLKRRVRGDGRGETFLSLSLDDPSLPSALNVAAFKNSGDSSWTVTWRRRQSQAAEADE